MALAAAEWKAPSSPEQGVPLPLSRADTSLDPGINRLGFTPEQAAAAAAAAAAVGGRLTAAAVPDTGGEGDEAATVAGTTSSFSSPPPAAATAAAATAAATATPAPAEAAAAAAAAAPSWSANRGVHLLVAIHGHRGSWTAFFPLVEAVVVSGSWGGSKLYRHPAHPPPLPAEAQPQTQGPSRWHSFSLDFNEEATALHPALVDQQVSTEGGARVYSRAARV